MMLEQQAEQMMDVRSNNSRLEATLAADQALIADLRSRLSSMESKLETEMASKVLSCARMQAYADWWSSMSACANILASCAKLFLSLPCLKKEHGLFMSHSHHEKCRPDVDFKCRVIFSTEIGVLCCCDGLQADLLARCKSAEGLISASNEKAAAQAAAMSDVEVKYRAATARLDILEDEHAALQRNIAQVEISGRFLLVCNAASFLHPVSIQAHMQCVAWFLLFCMCSSTPNCFNIHTTSGISTCCTSSGLFLHRRRRRAMQRCVRAAQSSRRTSQTCRHHQLLHLHKLQLTR